MVSHSTFHFLDNIPLMCVCVLSIFLGSSCQARTFRNTMKKQYLIDKILFRLIWEMRTSVGRYVVNLVLKVITYCCVCFTHI